MAPLKLSHLATEGAEQDLEEVLLEDTPIGPTPRRAEGRDTAFAERPTPRRTWLSRLRGLRRLERSALASRAEVGGPPDAKRP